MSKLNFKLIDFDKKYNSTIAEWRRVIEFQGRVYFKLAPKKETIEIWHCLKMFVSEIFKIDPKSIYLDNEIIYKHKDLQQAFIFQEVSINEKRIRLYCFSNKQHFWLVFEIKRGNILVKNEYIFIYSETLKHFKTLEVINPADRLFISSFKRIAQTRFEAYETIFKESLKKYQIVK